MQASEAAQRAQKAPGVPAGSILVIGRCAVGGTSLQALACDAPEAAGLPKCPDGNHGDNLKTVSALGTGAALLPPCPRGVLGLRRVDLMASGGGYIALFCSRAKYGRVVVSLGYRA